MSLGTLGYASPAIISSRLFISMYLLALKQIGLKMYHMVSLKFENPTAEFVCPGPRLIGENEVRRHFPLLSSDFKWGVVVYDGEMDDSRLLMETLLTSTVENYDDGTLQD